MTIIDLNTPTPEHVRDRVAGFDLCRVLESVYNFENNFLKYNGQGNPLELAFDVFTADHRPRDLKGDEWKGVWEIYSQRMDQLGALLTRVTSQEWDMEPTEVITPPGGRAPQEFTLHDRITRLIEATDDSYEILFRYVRSVKRMYDPAAHPEDDGLSTLLRISTLGAPGMVGEKEEKLNTYQKLIIRLLNKIQRNGWKRYKSYCMEQVLTDEGMPTHAWVPVRSKYDNGAPMTIEKFVHQATPKEHEHELWKMMTSKASMTRDLVEHLQKASDIQFPDIRKDRNMWSFSNGILMGKTMEFLPYTSSECSKLSSSIASAKYFSQSFDTAWLDMDWYDIQTPNIQHILDYQKFDREVCEWVYALLGRLCFDVNELDGWQVIPFLKGLAGTGKSTIVTKVAKHFYDPEDVKTMSNNIEKKFGLSSIMDANLFLAPEVKGDIALDQAEFQSCISGEDVSVAVKNKAARSGNWKVPGLMAGNEVPNWRDNSGSILRRIVTMEFGTFVDQDQVDTQLGKKLFDECGTIMAKCLLAYHAKIKEVGRRDVWDALPPYFHAIQKKISQSTSPVQNFLDSDTVTYGRGLKMPKTIFIQAFRAHCQDNSLGSHKITDDLFAGPMMRKGLRTDRLKEETYNGEVMQPGWWVIGCDIVSEHGANNFC